MAFLLFLSSLPPSVFYYTCFVVALTILGALALKFGFEDETGFYEEVQKDGKVRLAFQFPPPEAPEQRRKRWLRALRKRFWPGLAKCPSDLACHPSEKAEQDVQKFLEALVQATLQTEVPKAASLPPVWDAYSEYSMCNEPPAAEICIPAKDAARMKKKIFNVVINAGPPKSLPPITEENSCLEDAELGIAQEQLASRGNLLWTLLGFSRRTKVSSLSWFDFDAEPIMTVGNVSATRAVLWATLKRLEKVQSACC